MEILVFVVALAVILLGAELFTNGIEWFGHRLNLGEGAVGSVLAAVATALPETLIPVIAIIGPILTGRPVHGGHRRGRRRRHPRRTVHPRHAGHVHHRPGGPDLCPARRPTADMSVNVEVMAPGRRLLPGRLWHRDRRGVPPGGLALGRLPGRRGPDRDLRPLRPRPLPPGRLRARSRTSPSCTPPGYRS